MLSLTHTAVRVQAAEMDGTGIGRWTGTETKMGVIDDHTDLFRKILFQLWLTINFGILGKT